LAWKRIFRDMMMNAQSIQEAVVVLYSTGDPGKREQANQYLMAFTETEEAWSVGLELLTSCDVREVQYFAANVVYTKITRDWMQLKDPGVGARLSSTLLEFLRRSLHYAQGDPVERVVGSRICLAVAGLAIKMADGLQGVLQVRPRWKGLFLSG
jgi:hypothetical protein